MSHGITTYAHTRFYAVRGRAMPRRLPGSTERIATCPSRHFWDILHTVTRLGSGSRALLCIYKTRHFFTTTGAPPAPRLYAADFDGYKQREQLCASTSVCLALWLHNALLRACTHAEHMLFTLEGTAPSTPRICDTVTPFRFLMPPTKRLTFMPAGLTALGMAGTR